MEIIYETTVDEILIRVSLRGRKTHTVDGNAKVYIEISESTDLYGKANYKTITWNEFLKLFHRETGLFLSELEEYKKMIQLRQIIQKIEEIEIRG